MHLLAVYLLISFVAWCYQEDAKAYGLEGILEATCWPIPVAKKFYATAKRLWKE